MHRKTKFLSLIKQPTFSSSIKFKNIRIHSITYKRHTLELIFKKKNLYDQLLRKETKFKMKLWLHGFTYKLVESSFQRSSNASIKNKNKIKSK